MDQPTQQLPPAPPPKRRSRVLILSAAFGVLLVAGVLAVVMTAGNRTETEAAAGEDLDLLFAPAAAGPDSLGEQPPDSLGEHPPDPPGHPDRPFRHGKRGPLHLDEGEKVVAGTVVSAGADNLVVRKDNGAEVTVPTDDDTRVRGNGNRALSDLQADERVIVKAGSDGTADAVLAVRAHATGTVTRLDGDRATVVGPGGLTKELDLSGVPQRPAVGTVIVAVGTATDGGATLKVEQLKEIPTLG
jgi:hypothetical protein